MLSTEIVVAVVVGVVVAVVVGVVVAVVVVDGQCNIFIRNKSNCN